jgi:hypothetical protein
VTNVLLALLARVRDSARDLTPIVVVIAFFQAVVLRQPIPNLADLVVGGLMVLVGLTLFVRGLELGVFPLGDSMAYAFARKGSLPLLFAFAFLLGFGTTVAEPELVAIAYEAAGVAAAGGMIADDAAARDAYAFGLCVTVGVAVGFAIVVGVLRIVRGWPIQYLIVGAYLAIVAMTAVAPREIVGIAYDSGGITASTVTVPLVTALGVGLASSIKGRNPMIDGFGLIAFASLTPMIFVMAYGMVILWG